MLAARLAALEFASLLRRPLGPAIALAAVLAYAVGEAARAESWLQLGAATAAWSTVILPIALLHMLAESIGRDRGGLRDMTWSKPTSSLVYILIRAAAPIALLLVLWASGMVTAGAVYGAIAGPPTAALAARFAWHGALLAVPNLLFLTAFSVLASVATDRRQVVYGSIIAVWAGAVFLGAPNLESLLFPLYTAQPPLSEVAGYGALGAAIHWNRVLSLAGTVLCLSLATHLLSGRRNQPERWPLLVSGAATATIIPVAALLIASPAPREAVLDTERQWIARAVAAVMASEAPAPRPWREGSAAGIRTLTFGDTGSARAAAEVVQTARGAYFCQPSVIAGIAEVPFLRWPAIEDPDTAARRLALEAEVPFPLPRWPAIESGALLLPERSASLPPANLRRLVAGVLGRAGVPPRRPDEPLPLLLLPDPAREALALVQAWGIATLVLPADRLEAELALWSDLARAPRAPLPGSEAARARERAWRELEGLGVRGGDSLFHQPEAIERAVQLARANGRRDLEGAAQTLCAEVRAR